MRQHSRLRGQKLEARTEWTQEVAYLLEDYVDYPAVNLPERSFLDPEQISNADIEAAAEECRLLWQLGRGAIFRTLLWLPKVQASS